VAFPCNRAVSALLDIENFRNYYFGYRGRDYQEKENSWNLHNYPT
jgi:hypothetical protein